MENKVVKMAYPKWIFDKDYEEYVGFAMKEQFKNHKANVVMNNERLLMIDWIDKDGSYCYAVHYILDKERGTFIIYGDLGEATACWYHPVELDDLLSYLHSCYYFIEKITVGTTHENDSRVGIQQLMEKMEDVEDSYKEEGKDTFELAEALADMISLYEEYGEQVYANDTFNELWDEYLGEQEYDLGEVVSPHVYLWVLGFFMACEDAGLLERK